MMSKILYILFFISFSSFSQQGETYILKNSSGNILKNSSGEVLSYVLDPVLWLTTKVDSLNDYTYRDGGQGFGNYVDTVLDYSSHGNIADQTTATYQPIFNPPDSAGWNFDGSDDEIALPNMGDFSSDISLSMWVNIKNTNYYEGPFSYVDASLQGVQFVSKVGYSFQPELIIYDGTSEYAHYAYAVNQPENTWMHYVWVITDQDNVKLYVNGDEKTLIAGEVSYAGQGLNIGVGYQHFNGSIDEVMIFNKVLSKKQINFIYNQQKNRHP